MHGLDTYSIPIVMVGGTYVLSGGSIKVRLGNLRLKLRARKPRKPRK